MPMMRMIIFLSTNLSIMLVFGLILHITGIKSDSLYGLMILSGVTGFGGAFISLMLSKWIALRAVNGRIIEVPSDEKENWLVQTISKQAKQVGIAIPQIAIYNASNINAFATGARRDSSLIAVSSGLLQSMSRDETEAVLAHEMAHIANGDMVTMTLVQGVVNTFVIFISKFVAQLVSNFLSSNHNEPQQSHHYNSMVYFLISSLLGIIFGILASIITMWYSRYREFYADAGSAKQVGCNKMIAALERIKSSSEPQEPDNIAAFCINGKKNNLSELFRSHPPLDKRIEALRNGQYINK